MFTDYSIHAKVKMPLVATAMAILEREVYERSGVTVTEAPIEQANLLLDIQPGIGIEGYRILEMPDGQLAIIGDSDRGLLYGVGKFLHDANYAPQCFTPGRWRGSSVPQCSLRGIFFAFHNNYYSYAPLDEIQRYMEDLALWGVNTIAFHFHQYRDMTNPEARAGYTRQHAILQHARSVGMRIALLKEPNIAIEATYPREIGAEEFPDTVPPRRGYAPTRICPSKADGFAYLSDMLEGYLDGYQDIGLDYVVTFPYDAGGCGCADCWPWGARGYLRIAKEFFRLARERYPECQRVLGTWCFDVREESDGEYAGLAQVLAGDNGWVDYLMADSHEDFPPYLLEHGAPGGLPIINFAEISMWGRFPWGGSGANPLPERLQRLWGQARQLLAGGLPYSEGNFEDLNKVIYSGFYWDKSASAADTVRAYIAYEFSPQVVDLVAEAITLLECTLPHDGRRPEDVERAYELFVQADTLLTPRARASWRWRILYLRAVVDHELLHSPEQPSDRCDAAYEELLSHYHVEDGWFCVAPPSRAYRARKALKESKAAAAALPPGAAEGIAP